MVATPIGNLEDITLRAVRVLRSVGLIAAEDTRRTAKLLARYKIRKPMVSYHDFNKQRVAPGLLKKIAAGEDLALVSDAGSPGISDPGFHLVNLAIADGIQVVPIPGPSSVVCALQVSGLPTDCFTFEGFLPRKKGKRGARIRALAQEPCTMVFFESPNRLAATVSELLDGFGDRRVAVCRELTKVYEEVTRTRLSDAAKELAGGTVRGEVVLVVEGKRKRKRVGGEATAAQEGTVEE
ncbi:MAG: 16S rRNA (cytidine(1402)-2'-O)-methyltransferase [Candidatus Eisenbacteria bacterium]|nr:16S rRNA (cytidine(1402)-2'-O)-methyltransferase [Candidatus Eisenbacteria bacterium]